MYFEKLNIDFDIPEFKVGDLANGYGVEIDNVFRGIWYNHIPEEPLKILIPKESRDQFSVWMMQVNSFILPHTDSETTSVINFYINTGNCITQFYDVKDGAKPFQLPEQTDGYVYTLDSLEPGPSFYAEPGDVYLLDVSKVHSVIPTDKREVERKAICLGSSSLNFEQVKELF